MRVSPLAFAVLIATAAVGATQIVRAQEPAAGAPPPVSAAPVTTPSTAAAAPEQPAAAPSAKRIDPIVAPVKRVMPKTPPPSKPVVAKGAKGPKKEAAAKGAAKDKAAPKAAAAPAKGNAAGVPPCAKGFKLEAKGSKCVAEKAPEPAKAAAAPAAGKTEKGK